MWIGHRKKIRFERQPFVGANQTKDRRSKRQLSNLFTEANSHYQRSWKNQIIL